MCLEVFLKFYGMQKSWCKVPKGGRSSKALLNWAVLAHARWIGTAVVGIGVGAVVGVRVGAGEGAQPPATCSTPHDAASPSGSAESPLPERGRSQQGTTTFDWGGPCV